MPEGGFVGKGGPSVARRTAHWGAPARLLARARVEGPGETPMIRTILFLVVVGALGCGSGSGSGGNGNPSGNNHAPVAGPTATTTAVVMGQSTQLQARASDQDGDALTYSWTQTSPASPQGTFSSTTSDSPTWTAPTVTATTKFALAVTVSDGKGGTTTAGLGIYAKTSSDPSFIADIEPLFDAVCMPCHSNPGPAGGLPLEAANAYAALVNVPAIIDCKGMVRVKPGDPDNSELILSVTGGTCGNRMPLTNPTYFDKATAELALVRTWIQNGAPNN